MRRIPLFALGAAALVLAACAPGAGVGAGQDGNVEAGLSVQLQAQAGDHGGGGNLVLDMASINVSVAGVAAHAAGGGWVMVSDQPALVDLLRLQDHAEELGFANLPGGKITQIRLYVADDGVSNAVDNQGVTSPLTIPSGLQTGVKLKGPFDLGECERGTAIAILDLEKSILIHGRGNHDDLILRPTIHRTDYAAVPADLCDGGDGPGDNGGSGGDGGEVGGGGGDGTTDPGVCPPNTEGCQPASGGTDTGSGGTTGDGTGTGDGSTSGGTTDGGTTDGTGSGTTSGGTSGSTGSGTGTDTGDACAPILTESGFIDPCP
jgi:hypothetical protein